MVTLLINFILFLSRKDDIMMAMLWAQQIMLKETMEEAKEMYAKVPRLLKDQVRQILIDSGMESIVNE